MQSDNFDSVVVVFFLPDIDCVNFKLNSIPMWVDEIVILMAIVMVIQIH